MLKNINILVPFFEEPNRRFHLRELAKVLNLSPANIKKQTDILVKKNLLLRHKERNFVIFQANIDNILFRELKKSYIILKIVNSGILEFLDKEFIYPTVILFGSASKGEDSKNSDLDLFVLTETKKKIVLVHFEKKLNRSIQLLIMNHEEFEKTKKQNPNLINNIVNGIKLSGFLKVV